MKTKFVSEKFAWNKILFALFFLALALGIAPQAAAEVQVNTIGNHTTIGLRFEQAVTDPSASDPGSYLVNGGDINVLGAVLQPDGVSVELILDAPVGEFFSVGISNVVDVFANSISTIVTGFFSDYISTSVGTAADPNPPGHVFTALKDTFDVTASGSDMDPIGTNDFCHFVYQTVIGNFDMAVLVTRLDNVDPSGLSKAGLMVREGLAPGGRMVQTFFTPTEGDNHIQSTFRQAFGVPALFFGDPAVPSDPLRWLRITRTNNLFTTYYSSNGVDWIVHGITTLSLNSTLNVGMVTASHANGVVTTASFTSFGVLGARPGDGVKPKLNVKLFENKLILNWQRTPRDFAVQVGTSLIPDTLQPGTEQNPSNATQWAVLMLPIFDTSLTGTNAMMPTPGRYMPVPINLFSNAPMFFRMFQVDRVIPDPPTVTPGLIMSQASFNLTNYSSGGTLCGASVLGSTALAQVGLPVYFPIKTNYTFTTEDCGSTYQTVLQVGKFASIGILQCDPAALSTSTYKARVRVTNSAPNLGYTFVVASPSTPPSSSPLKVRIDMK